MTDAFHRTVDGGWLAIFDLRQGGSKLESRSDGKELTLTLRLLHVLQPLRVLVCFWIVLLAVGADVFGERDGARLDVARDI